MEDLLSWWFDWGAIIFLMLTIVIAALVLFEMSRRKNVAIGWPLGVILPIVLIFPSVIFKTQLTRGIIVSQVAVPATVGFGAGGGLAAQAPRLPAAAQGPVVQLPAAAAASAAGGA